MLISFTEIIKFHTIPKRQIYLLEVKEYPDWQA